MCTAFELIKGLPLEKVYDTEQVFEACAPSALACAPETVRERVAGVWRADTERAWAQQVASEACLALTDLYLRGEGVAVGEAAAVHWLRRGLRSRTAEHVARCWQNHAHPTHCTPPATLAAATAAGWQPWQRVAAAVAILAAAVAARGRASAAAVAACVIVAAAVATAWQLAWQRVPRGGAGGAPLSGDDTCCNCRGYTAARDALTTLARSPAAGAAAAAALAEDAQRSAALLASPLHRLELLRQAAHAKLEARRQEEAEQQRAAAAATQRAADAAFAEARTREVACCARFAAQRDAACAGGECRRRGCYERDYCTYLHRGRHDLPQHCRWFAEGTCRQGERCWFNHLPPKPQRVYWY
jgi:hypothetical protein